MPLKVLIVTPDFPYPPNHGGRVDYFNRIKYMQTLGLAIHLVSTTGSPVSEDHLEEMKKYVLAISLIHRDTNPFNLLSTQPFQILSRKGLKSLPLEAVVYDILFLEGEYVVPILKNPTLRFKKAYLRVHNNESRYFTSLAVASLPKLSSLYYVTEAIKFGLVLSNIHRKMDRLLYISSEEYKHSKYPFKSSHLLPVLLNPETASYTRPAANQVVLFVGSLFMPNNLNGLKFFIRNVHPGLLQHPHYRFIIAGSTRNNEALQKKILYQFKGVPKIEFHFDVTTEEMNRLYSQASAFANPVFHGAGVKLKVLEAIYKGLIVVSTSEGISGTGLRNGRDVLVADDAKAMVQLFSKVFFGQLDHQTICASARAQVQSSKDALADIFEMPVQTSAVVQQ